MSPRAPSRSQLARARRDFSGDALAELKRGLRAASVEVATNLGVFDPKAGSWTHPGRAQCIAGAETRILTNNPPWAKPGRELVGIACRNSNGNERLLLDADFSDGTVNGGGARSAAMLRRLLDEHDAKLRGGLRGFIHDMSMTPDTIDAVLDMGVLPIVKVPRTPGGQLRSVDLGSHTFTGVTGTRDVHDVIAVDGTPAVVFTNRGERTIVPLRRQRIRWTNSRSRYVAHGRYTMPSSPGSPRPPKRRHDRDPPRQHRPGGRFPWAPNPGAASDPRG